MQQYESSTATLRAILSHPSLQRDKIDATLEAMAEASAEQREIDEMIRVGMQVDTGAEAEDDEALQAELAGLVAEVQNEQKEREELRALEATAVAAVALPSVPSGTLIGDDSAEGLGSHTDTPVDVRTPIKDRQAT